MRRRRQPPAQPTISSRSSPSGWTTHLSGPTTHFALRSLLVVPLCCRRRGLFPLRARNWYFASTLTLIRTRRRAYGKTGFFVKTKGRGGGFLFVGSAPGGCSPFSP